MSSVDKSDLIRFESRKGLPSSALVFLFDPRGKGFSTPGFIFLYGIHFCTFTRGDSGTRPKPQVSACIKKSFCRAGNFIRSLLNNYLAVSVKIRRMFYVSTSLTSRVEN